MNSANDRLVPCGPRRSRCQGQKSRSLTGPSPADRGKPGSKIHALSDRAGLPLVLAIPAVQSRRGPRRRKPDKLHADKAYDQDELRDWVRKQGITVRIARKGIESSQKLGKHHWVIERCIAWLFGYRRLTIRYERYANHYCAFLTLAATLTCHKKLTK